MLKMYRFYLDCFRDGCVVGLFIEDEEKVKKAIGKNVYFGEILGKHSNVFCVLAEENLKEVTSDQEFVAKAKEYGLDNVGYNPLDYIS